MSLRIKIIASSEIGQHPKVFILLPLVQSPLLVDVELLSDEEVMTSIVESMGSAWWTKIWIFCQTRLVNLKFIWITDSNLHCLLVKVNQLLLFSTLCSRNQLKVKSIRVVFFIDLSSVDVQDIRPLIILDYQDLFSFPLLFFVKVKCLHSPIDSLLFYGDFQVDLVPHELYFVLLLHLTGELRGLLLTCALRFKVGFALNNL